MHVPLPNTLEAVSRKGHFYLVESHIAHCFTSILMWFHQLHSVTLQPDKQEKVSGIEVAMSFYNATDLFTGVALDLVLVVY